MKKGHLIAEHENDSEDEKANCCNNYSSNLYTLRGQDKKHGMCAECFVGWLIETDSKVVLGKKAIPAPKKG